MPKHVQERCDSSGVIAHWMEGIWNVFFSFFPGRGLPRETFSFVLIPDEYFLLILPPPLNHRRKPFSRVSPFEAGLLSSLKELYLRQSIFGMTLYEALLSVKDPRRAEGKRTNLQQMFCMIIISNLCGHFGGRPIARFAKAYEDSFTQILGLQHGVPSHVTFSNLINRVDQAALIRAFNRWSESYVPISAEEAVSGDGKALGSTINHAHGSRQDFQAIVSIFCQRTGLVRSLEQYRNAKVSEINIVEFLVEQLKNRGITIVLDALHTKKNG